MISNKTKWTISVTAFVVLLFGAIAILVHQKASNLKQAFQQLVATKTNGEYVLYIGDYTLDWDPLTVSFDSLLIEQQEFSHSSVKRVWVPHALLKLGAFSDFLKTNQVDIQTLVIDEPVFELAPQDTLRSKVIQFTQQVVKLYPAVKSILERFNVQHFEIKKASIGIKKGQRMEQQLNLIDLLVEHWNAKSLSPDRQLRLTIDNQQLNLTKGVFDFSGFVYDFRKRELRFSGFQYSTEDSVTHSTVHVGGEYILLQNLDYHELFQNQRLIYEKVLLHKPNIEAVFKIKAWKKNTRFDEIVITDLLKRTVGNLSLDSAIFRDAAIHLTLLNGNDSIKIDLPKVTVATDHFKVMTDQKVFQVGNIEIDMSQTTITLQDDVVLSFDKVFINPYRKLIIANLLVYKDIPENRIATIPSLELGQIDLMKFISKKELIAGSIEIKDARFNISASHLKRKAETIQVIPFERLDVKRFTIRNSLLEYADKTNSFSSRGLNATITNLKADSIQGYDYTLVDAAVREVWYSQEISQTQVHLQKLSLRGKMLAIENLEFKNQHLKISAVQFEAAHQGNLTQPQQTDLTRWKSIAFKEVDVTGSLPAHAGTGQKNSELSIASETLKIPLMNVNLHAGGTWVATSVIDFAMTNFRHNGNELLCFEQVSGVAPKLFLKTSKFEATCQQLNFQIPHSLDINQVVFASGKNTFGLSTLKFRQIDRFENHVRIESATAGQVTLSEGERVLQSHSLTGLSLELNAERHAHESLKLKSIVLGASKFLSGEKILFSADSIIGNDATLREGKPHLGSLEVFSPYMNLIPSNSSKAKSNVAFDLSVLDQLTFHPGRVELDHQKFIYMGKVTGDLRARNVTVQTIAMTTTKYDIQINQLKLLNDRIHCDSVSVLPNEKWFARREVEEGKLILKLFDLQLKNQYFDSLLQSQKLIRTELEIGRLAIQVSRDKTLPDGPEIKKPGTLSHFFKLPKVVDLTSIVIYDGDIDIAETSDKTGLTGSMSINDVNARIQINSRDQSANVNLVASGKLYQQGSVQLKYVTLKSDTFQLQARVKDLDLIRLNKMILPTQSVEIKSGILDSYDLEMVAADDRARGSATISYRDLHIEFHKKGEPDKNVFGRELLTFVADGVVLKNKKKDARALFEQQRIQHKMVFNYWAISFVKGAMESIRKGH